MAVWMLWQTLSRAPPAWTSTWKLTPSTVWTKAPPDVYKRQAHAAEHHRVRAAGLFYELFVHEIAQPDEEDDGQHKAQQKAQQRRSLLDDLAGKLGPRVVEALGQVRVVHQAGLVNLLFVFIRRIRSNLAKLIRR